MKAYSLLTLALLRIYLRDRLTVVLSLALMVFMMTLFGLAMGDEQFRVELPVAVLDKAANPASQRALQALGNDDLLSVVAVRDEAQMQEQIRQATVIAGLVLEPGYGQPGRAAATLMTSNSTTKWQRIGAERLNQLLLDSQGRPAGAQWSVDARPIEVAKNRYIDFIFPGMLAMAIMQTCLGSGVVVLEAKKSGVLRRLRLTPVSGASLFGGFVSARLLIVGLHLVALAAVAVFGFDAAVAAHWAELALAVGLGCTTFLALGIMVAVLSPTLEAGNLVVQMASLPMSFLCGIFFKVSTLPGYLAWLPDILPLTYLAEMMRGMVNLGMPLSHYSHQLAVLGAWSGAAVLVSAGASRFRSREES
jgi:ABC-2 type transport system permease protein